MLTALYKKYLQSRSVVIDSRKTHPGDLFFALQGTQQDGHAFVQQALDQGAAYAIIDKADYQFDTERCVLVEDVLTTLQQLARYHRTQLSLPIIAITGSMGKTTTKELLQVVLSQRYVTAATMGNLNNHIGMPLTLLSISPEAEMAVVEMGANHIGEIAQLCDLALPTHGLITCIAPVHIEGFGSLAGVSQGKSELYHHLLQHQGQVFVNASDPLLSKLAQAHKHPIYYLPTIPPVDCQLVQANPYVTYRYEGQTFTTQLLGTHQISHIAAALCVGKHFGVSMDKAHEALCHYTPSNNRAQLIQKGSNQILLDAYNANPRSMQSALHTLQRLPARHKVLILGEMLELGNITQAAHRELVQWTTEASYKAVLLCGTNLANAAKHNPQACYFPTKEALAAYLRKQTFSHTAFLIKGSRSLALETLLEML